MKKLILLFTIFISSFAFSQTQTRDVVYLKNGSIIKGQIKEMNPQLPRESFAWCTKFDYVEPSISWPPLSRQRGTNWHSNYNYEITELRLSSDRQARIYRP